MELTPEQYRCATHGTDLTSQVSAELAEQVPVAFWPWRRKPKPFKVVVTCPGDGHPHDLTVNGQVQY